MTLATPLPATTPPAAAATDPDALAALAVTLHHLDEAHRRYRNSVAATAGLHATDLAAIIAVEPGGLTPRELGRSLGLRSGTITAVVDRLHAAGLVARNPSPTDRRSSTLHLTVDGAALMAEFRDGYRAVLAASGAAMPLQGALFGLADVTAALEDAAGRCA